MKVAMVMIRMVQVILHQQNVADQMVSRRNKGKVTILYLISSMVLLYLIVEKSMVRIGVASTTQEWPGPLDRTGVLDPGGLRRARYLPRAALELEA
jgi:hypothetical protein